MVSDGMEVSAVILERDGTRQAAEPRQPPTPADPPAAALPGEGERPDVGEHRPPPDQPPAEGMAGLVEGEGKEVGGDEAHAS